MSTYTIGKIPQDYIDNLLNKKGDEFLEYASSLQKYVLDNDYELTDSVDDILELLFPDDDLFSSPLVETEEYIANPEKLKEVERSFIYTVCRQLKTRVVPVTAIVFSVTDDGDDEKVVMSFVSITDRKYKDIKASDKVTDVLAENSERFTNALFNSNVIMSAASYILFKEDLYDRVENIQNAKKYGLIPFECIEENALELLRNHLKAMGYVHQKNNYADALCSYIISGAVQKNLFTRWSRTKKGIGFAIYDEKDVIVYITSKDGIEFNVITNSTRDDVSDLIALLHAGPKMNRIYAEIFKTYIISNKEVNELVYYVKEVDNLLDCNDMPRLYNLSEEEREKATEFYNKMFDDIVTKVTTTSQKYAEENKNTDNKNKKSFADIVDEVFDDYNREHTDD